MMALETESEIPKLTQAGNFSSTFFMGGLKCGYFNHAVSNFFSETINLRVCAYPLMLLLKWKIMKVDNKIFS